MNKDHRYIEFKIHRKNYHEVRQLIRESKVKHGPYLNYGLYYIMPIDKDHPIATFLALNYS